MIQRAPRDFRGSRSLVRGLRVVAATCIFAIAAAFAAAAGLPLAAGAAGVGHATGWWPGDNTMNDGEGPLFAFVGLSLLAVSMIGWAASMPGVLAWLSSTTRRRTVAVGLCLLFGVAVASGIYFSVA